MIRPLRRLHGLVWLAFAILLPLLLAASLYWRPKPPLPNANFPTEQAP